MLSFFRDQIKVIRPGVKLSRGTEIPDWDNATESVYKGVSVQMQNTNENEGERVLNASERMRVFAPVTADVREGDKVEFRGELFKVHGIPFIWESPTRRISNLQFLLVRWVG